MSRIRHCLRPIPVGNTATGRLEAQDAGNFRSPTILVLGEIEDLGRVNGESFYQDVGRAAPGGIANGTYVTIAILLYRTLEKTVCP